MRFFALLLVLTASLSAKDWKNDLKALLEARSKVEQESLIAKILVARPDWKEVSTYIRSISFIQPEKTGIAILNKTTCIDSVERPWILYIPGNYRADIPTPLLVILHGGVSRPKLIEDPLGYANENPFTSFGEKEGWLVLYPFGQSGATWWDDVGLAIIKNLIREVKRTVCIIKKVFEKETMNQLLRYTK